MEILLETEEKLMAQKYEIATLQKPNQCCTKKCQIHVQCMTVNLTDACRRYLEILPPYFTSGRWHAVAAVCLWMYVTIGQDP
jgi:hypothetical protein